MRRYATWCLGVAAAAALATSAYALDFTGLVAAYTFDEGAGDTATRFMCRRAVHRHHFALRHRAHVVLRWEEEAVQ